MKNIRKFAAALSLFALTAGSSMAAPVRNGSPVASEEPNAETLQVKYIGEDAEFLYFRVAVKKGANRAVEFAVSDRLEGELYSAVFSTDRVQTLKIEKRFDQQLDFTVRAGGKNISRSFNSHPALALGNR